MSDSSKNLKTAAVIGSGPAGLMAADTLARQGVKVTLYEKRKSLGRKLLVAGSSGLNISYDSPASDFADFYRGHTEHFKKLFSEAPPQAWIKFIENELGIPTFKGTSRRFFVEGMKASLLLKTWTERLRRLGVEIVTDHELSNFELLSDDGVQVEFTSQPHKIHDVALLALGGGSWEPTENPLRWIEILRKKKIAFDEFQSSNCGFEIDWPKALLDEAEGKPIKNVVLTSSKGKRSGELVITRYGLEGTPIYFAGISGTVYLDLKPELDESALLARLNSGKENLSPIRRVKKFLRLSDAALALLFHMAPKEARTDLKKMAQVLKRFPIQLERPRPLEEAISSSGGLKMSELTPELMLKGFPGVFAAGEMLDWDAPTGGFLIQACVSQGAFVAERMLRYLKSRNQ